MRISHVLNARRTGVATALAAWAGSSAGGPVAKAAAKALRPKPTVKGAQHRVEDHATSTASYDRTAPAAVIRARPRSRPSAC